MTFDKNKVYTSLNADEVKVGSIGCFGDSISALKDIMKNEELFEVEQIFNENYMYRFKASNGLDYTLFYLVEEPKNEEYCPYKNTDELMEDFRKRICGFAYEGNLPFVWVKEKNGGDKYLITGFIKDDSNTYCVLIGTCFVSLEVLFKSYTYLDGTPCGKQIGSTADRREEE